MVVDSVATVGEVSIGRSTLRRLDRMLYEQSNHAMQIGLFMIEKARPNEVCCRVIRWGFRPTQQGLNDWLFFQTGNLRAVSPHSNCVTDIRGCSGHNA